MMEHSAISADGERKENRTGFLKSSTVFLHKIFYSCSTHRLKQL
ncbi:hypothetical protein CLOSTHATH_02905 [Hungatella hathewayi DSM 13479]|uniref:Uncharacterized protein n=1 Tax=Hungatella hathewayi DSM 13479 TaxID=566550 RepID=D3AH18_9FIRM|nr:hypothetical protein CLOSTHATH_02905 [Hungatella hathewayi DSM 13479]